VPIEEEEEDYEIIKEKSNYFVICCNQVSNTTIFIR
jgi:hypothetical protein